MTLLLIYFAISVLSVMILTYWTKEMAGPWQVEAAVYIISIGWPISVSLLIIAMVRDKIKKR